MRMTRDEIEDYFEAFMLLHNLWKKHKDDISLEGDIMLYKIKQHLLDDFKQAVWSYTR